MNIVDHGDERAIGVLDACGVRPIAQCLEELLRQIQMRLDPSLGGVVREIKMQPKKFVTTEPAIAMYPSSRFRRTERASACVPAEQITADKTGLVRAVRNYCGVNRRPQRCTKTRASLDGLDIDERRTSREYQQRRAVRREPR